MSVAAAHNHNHEETSATPTTVTKRPTTTIFQSAVDLYKSATHNRRHGRNSNQVRRPCLPRPPPSQSQTPSRCFAAKNIVSPSPDGGIVQISRHKNSTLIDSPLRHHHTPPPPHHKYRIPPSTPPPQQICQTHHHRRRSMTTVSPITPPRLHYSHPLRALPKFANVQHKPTTTTRLHHQLHRYRRSTWLCGRLTNHCRSTWVGPSSCGAAQVFIYPNLEREKKVLGRMSGL